MPPGSVCIRRLCSVMVDVLGVNSLILKVRSLPFSNYRVIPTYNFMILLIKQEHKLSPKNMHYILPSTYDPHVGFKLGSGQDMQHHSVFSFTDYRNSTQDATSQYTTHQVPPPHNHQPFTHSEPLLDAIATSHYLTDIGREHDQLLASSPGPFNVARWRGPGTRRHAREIEAI